MVLFTSRIKNFFSVEFIEIEYNFGCIGLGKGVEIGKGWYKATNFQI